MVPGFSVDPPNSPVFGRSVDKPVLEPGPNRENAISSGDSDSSLVKDLTVTGHANAMKKLACQSGSMPFSVDVDFKKQPQDSLSSKNQQLIFEHQQRLSNQDIKNSKFVENSEVTKKSSSNAENIIVDSENLKDEVKCSTILVDIQSFQNLPPKISNQSSTKSSGASSSSEDWHTASKKVEGWDCTQMDAPVTLEDQIAPLRNTSTRRHAPKCESCHPLRSSHRLLSRLSCSAASTGSIVASFAAPCPAAPDGFVPAVIRLVSDMLVAAAHHRLTALAEVITSAVCPSVGAAATHQHRCHCCVLPDLVLVGGQSTE
ncbi:hypothetical protein KSP40_PGU021880 [Platanthera guangdongensis]|uniref:Uncharacterized protein n=1 Tax=Platanthera guangdongensis TaxID=2320717 RepID=A0ABR2MGH8_9ASPA